MPERDVSATYLRWSLLAPVFHRGYWLCTSLYLVVEAGLGPLQLVAIGTMQSLTGLVFEVPTGALADAVSRKRALVFAHGLMAVGMAATGLVTDFRALVVTQMVWGLAWTFWSGADVAWLTDELADRQRVRSVLTAGATRGQLGAVMGVVGFGVLAWATTLSVAIVVSGAGMAALGVYVSLRFDEVRFVPARGRGARASIALFAQGIAVARADRVVAVVLVATVLLHGAAEVFERLLARHLVSLGLPAALPPIAWLTALGVASLGVSAVALRAVEARIGGREAPRRLYALASGVAAAALVVVATAPDVRIALAGALFASGVGWPVARIVAAVRVNERTPSEVRATVQSLLGQAEYVGEIALGLTLGVLAQARGIEPALLGAALLAAGAALVAGRRHGGS